MVKPAQLRFAAISVSLCGTSLQTALVNARAEPQKVRAYPTLASVPICGPNARVTRATQPGRLETTPQIASATAGRLWTRGDWAREARRLVGSNSWRGRRVGSAARHGDGQLSDCPVRRGGFPSPRRPQTLPLTRVCTA